MLLSNYCFYNVHEFKIVILYKNRFFRIIYIYIYKLYVICLYISYIYHLYIICVKAFQTRQFQKLISILSVTFLDKKIMF